jgi:hypothetical protein
LKFSGIPRVGGFAKDESHGQGELVDRGGTKQGNNKRRLIAEIDGHNKLWRVTVGGAVPRIASEKSLVLRSFG